MKKIHFLFVILMVAMISPASYAAETLSIRQGDGEETIVLGIADPFPKKVFTLEKPDRLVVDVPFAHSIPQVSIPDNYDGDLVGGVRTGRFDPQTTRFVFELSVPVKVAGVSHNSKEMRVTIAPTGAPSTGAGKKMVKKDPPKPMIVIDAGHGGQDPGTIARDGTREKDIVLGYAKALKKKLLATGRYRVKLTREDDRFIVLRGRVDVARKAKADLFISLHADSAPEHSAQGLSVYTLSEKASDKETAALAARENKADVLSGMDLSTEREDVASILISLAGRETQNRSATMADLLVVNLDDKVALLPNTHRFAGFAVLKAPDIPSILIEIGFLSNFNESKKIRSDAHREKIVEGIVKSIDGYFRDNAPWSNE